MPLVAGREFTERDVDGAPLVAIVNESFARYFFGNQNPIGQPLRLPVQNNPGAMEIVGVVKDRATRRCARRRRAAPTARPRRENEMPRFVYTPYQQCTELNEMTIYVRATAGAATGAAGASSGGPARRRLDAGLRG